MPALTPGRVLRSREPRLVVENELAPGRHLFRLVVVDDGGLESAPVELVVTVLRRGATPVGPRDPREPRDPRPLDPRRPVEPRPIDPRIVRPNPRPDPRPVIRPIRPNRPIR